MADLAIIATAADVIHHEGLHLDRQNWDAWLALYRDDAVFWVPAWKGEHETTDNPDTRGLAHLPLFARGTRASE